MGISDNHNKKRNMFGFVKSEKADRPLGGDIYQEKQRRLRIIFGILGGIGFILLNLVLWFLTRV